MFGWDIQMRLAALGDLGRRCGTWARLVEALVGAVRGLVVLSMSPASLPAQYLRSLARLRRRGTRYRRHHA